MSLMSLIHFGMSDIQIHFRAGSVNNDSFPPVTNAPGSPIGFGESTLSWTATQNRIRACVSRRANAKNLFDSCRQRRERLSRTPSSIALDHDHATSLKA